MYRYVIFAFFFVGGGRAPAQVRKEVFHPNAYILELPPSWMKPKTLGIVNYILLETIDELKNRNFYSAGDADYRVRLFIDSLEVINEDYISSKHTFTYGFYAALAVYDSSNFPVSMLRIFGRDEWHDYMKNYGTPAPSRNTSYDPNVYDTAGVIVAQRPLPPLPQLATHPPMSSADILYGGLIEQKCERKLSEIQKYLRRRERL